MLRSARFWLAAVFASTTALAVPGVHAQASRSQSRGYTFSFFVGGTATDTGFTNARNTAITGGADFIVRPDARLSPSLEVRGSYPIDSGSLVGESNFLVGPRISFRALPRVHVYGDFLFGRGSLDFGQGVYAPNDAIIYEVTDGNVLAGGGGLTYNLHANFALQADAQIQRYTTPVVTQGSVRAAAYTFGVEYTLRLGHKR